MISNRKRGVFFLGFGVVFPVVFLFGGGVVTSTHGAHWTAMFGAGLIVGLIAFGPWVYLSAKAAPGAKSEHRPTVVSRSVGVLVGLVGFVLSNMLFRSELWSSDVVRHVFIVGTGLVLALFIPIGIGTLHAQAEQSHAADSASRAGSREESG